MADQLVPAPAEAELVRTVPPVLMARRLLAAERKLAAIAGRLQRARCATGCVIPSVFAADILAIIGSEEEP